VDLELAKKFGAKINASYYHTGSSGTWELEGTVKQREDIVFGQLHLQKGELRVAWKKDHWEPATAGFEFTWRQVKGSVKGTYDIERKKLDARGEAHLEEPLPLGKSGAQLEEASLEMVVKQNEPLYGRRAPPVFLALRVIRLLRPNSTRAFSAVWWTDTGRFPSTSSMHAEFARGRAAHVRHRHRALA
jgi:hypothetical protein